MIMKVRLCDYVTSNLQSNESLCITMKLLYVCKKIT